jgi:hypothetical protein
LRAKARAGSCRCLVRPIAWIPRRSEMAQEHGTHGLQMWNHRPERLGAPKSRREGRRSRINRGRDNGSGESMLPERGSRAMSGHSPAERGLRSIVGNYARPLLAFGV